MKRKNTKSKFKVIMLITLISVGFISIAYALLAQTLDITFNKVTQDALTWNIRFKKSGSSWTVSATQSSYNSNTTGISCGDATINSTNQLSVTIADTELSKPGDRCVWPLTVENKGSIKAKLKTVTANKGSNNCSVSGAQLTCGKIVYILATDSACTTKLAASPVVELAASTGTKQLYLCAYYPEETTSLATGLPITHTGISYTLTFEQY